MEKTRGQIEEFWMLGSSESRAARALFLSDPAAPLARLHPDHRDRRCDAHVPIESNGHIHLEHSAWVALDLSSITGSRSMVTERWILIHSFLNWMEISLKMCNEADEAEQFGML